MTSTELTSTASDVWGISHRIPRILSPYQGILGVDVSKIPFQRRPPLPLSSDAAHLFHQEGLQLLLAVLHPLMVGTIHHPDEPVGALKIVAPVGAQGLLAPHVPDIQLEPAGEREARQRWESQAGEGGAGRRMGWGILTRDAPGS